MSALPDTPPASAHQAALDYAAHGLRVLPIRPGEKRPPMPAWQEAATTNPDRIDAWWTGLYANHGVGIATGQGVFVLDVDIAGGKTGDETLRELEDTYGPLPDTPTVITGSGGLHIYLRHPDHIHIRNDAGRRLGPGLDIRGDGGQVVAPPTVHANGSSYEWEHGLSLDDLPIAQAPGWLLELLAEPPAPAPADITPGVMAGDDGPAARYNARTTWQQLLTADGWTLAHTDRSGTQHWTRPGKDPRDGTSATVGHQGRDTLTVFTSSVPGLEPERTYSRFGYTAAMHHGGDRSAFAAQLRRDELGDHTLTPFRPDTDDTTPPTSRRELAHLIDWNRFWEDDHADEQWLAYPVIPTGRAIALYAPAKAGKSTITLAIAAAAATGRPVLGKRTHPIAQVLYLDYEMTQADLQERLIELGYGPEDDLSSLHYALLPSLPPLDTVAGATAVLDLCDDTGAELVVVDTFGRAVEGEEDHADTVRDFYRHTGLALKNRGITYLRTDHSGKDVSKGMRGSSAKNDDVDLVWQLTRTDTRNGHGVRLQRTHSRISWVPDEIKILRIETDRGFDYVIEGDLRTFADGTAWRMEEMRKHGITAGHSYRKAMEIIKANGLDIRERQMREALLMMREYDAELKPFGRDTASVAVCRGDRDTESVAEASKSVAIVAAKGPLASEGPEVCRDDVDENLGHRDAVRPPRGSRGGGPATEPDFEPVDNPSAFIL